MKPIISKALYLALLIFNIGFLKAQNPGDTLRVSVFNYSSNNRDTVVSFPNSGLSFEKIIMRYSMRCKNGLVSDGTNRNQGCGEWDYSCNTFIVDSSKIEEEKATAPDYIISNFSGTDFNYTRKPIYDYYDFTAKKVILNSTISELKYAAGAGTNSIKNALNLQAKSGKTQIVYRATEMQTGGLSAGKIDGIILNSKNTGTAHFLKIKLKHFTASSMANGIPEMTGFVEVYHNNFDFVAGENKIIFNQSFNWNGTDNILIELTFTNSVPSAGIDLYGFDDTASSMISANEANALDLANLGEVALDASKMGAIDKEISIAFWAWGDAKVLPVQTSVIYGYGNNLNERQLNIHFPWSDGSIYFDCGFASGGYDRINKSATSTEQGGKWNHWVFTKNATTGAMNIYLNGTLWLSGTGKTKPIQILTLILGKDQNLQNNYKGKISELTIWNKALAQDDIQAWMFRKTENTHVNYTNLLAYYSMNEGTGQKITDSKFNLVSTGKNLQWTYDRGDQLQFGFTVSKQKPNIQWLRANYNLSISNITLRDSILRNPNGIEKYSVISKAGQKPVSHDVLKMDTAFALWEAKNAIIFNGDSGTIKGTMAISAQGKITIGTLNYLRRYPFYNEIMSFVTPYGIGIDLGIKGKSWYYDVTDFAPLFKNNKRIIMTMGGQYQEQMGLEFLFIVGTPPRNVLEFNQIWQGAARLGGPGIGSILSDAVFAPVNVPILTTGKSFKLKSTITGHGSDGEFEQNGGPIYHSVNINGGAPEFTWSSNINCSVNPITSQGGTWLIPRQGWCPGLRSLLNEFNPTSFLTPGTVANFDYDISSPQKSGGDYRYLVAHQLVTYGDPNFNLDARVVEIKAPSDNIEFAKRNPICANPVILVQNTGKTKITTIEFRYWINNTTVKQTWTWAGKLNFMDTITIQLPTWGLWANGMQNANNIFHIEISKVNNVSDDYALNNNLTSPVTIPDVIPGNFKIEVKTNNYPNENTVTLFNADGKIVSKNSYTVANKVTSTTYNLNGCYKLVVTDTGLDGMTWWANTAQGSGAVRIRNGAGSLIKNFSMDFGSFFEYNFTTNYALNAEKNDINNQINLYPNPASSKFSLTGNLLNNASISVMDLTGKTIISEFKNSTETCEFNTSNWTKGMYVIEIYCGEKRVVKKVLIN